MRVLADPTEKTCHLLILIHLWGWKMISSCHFQITAIRSWYFYQRNFHNVLTEMTLEKVFQAMRRNVVFSRYKGIIFHWWKQSSYSLFTNEIWRPVNLFRILKFFRPPSLKFLQIVMFYFGISVIPSEGSLNCF